MNIVLVGHVCIDHNVTENAEYTSWGSPAIYMATYVQKSLGEAPIIVSSYGPEILPYLPKVNILPNQPNSDKTLLYENYPLSQPRIWKAYQTEEASPPELTPEIKQALRRADLLVVCPILPNFAPDYLSTLIADTSQAALKLLCPQGYFRHIEDDGMVSKSEFTEADKIVPLFDLLVYSEEDHPKALELAKSWSQISGNTKFIVTQGPDGADIVDQTGTTPVPTTPIPSKEIIDSVGCGDVFAITAAYYYHSTGDIKQAVNQAHKAATKKLLTPTAQR